MEAAIAQHIQNTLSVQQDIRKNAEAALASASLTPGFSLALLNVVGAATVDASIRVTCAIYFKNFVKKYWKQIEGEPDKLHAPDRASIKASIVDLMIISPTSIQLQLSEAVTMIADNDFPEQWTELVPLLVSKLDANNFDINAGVLQTAHSIFKRWRHQFQSNKLFSEIKMVLDQFAAPFLAFFQATDALVDSNAQNPKALAVLFNVVLLLTKIFYSLNSQDYPEFFENNHEQFMALLKKYLVYTNPLLETGDDEEVGPIEKVKSSICEILDLYGTKYEEDFTTLPQFVETVWGLLTTTGARPKYDELVSKGIGFLTAVVRPVRHKHMFSNEVLRNICQSIIVPNMSLRDADIELFEDDSMEYIRRDLEGSDRGTRRGAATDLIRGLLSHFGQETTAIVSEYLTVLLAEYARDPKGNWKSKDTALYLIIAVSAKASSLQSGVTSVNEYIDTVSVFASNVLPDLQAPVSGPTQPIIKVDALKYVLTFRNQLTKVQILEVFPFIVQHLSSSNYVVYTYAAVCIERILAIKSGSHQMFSKTDIHQYVQPMLLRLFDLIQSNNSSSTKLAENDYLMKALMRVLLVARDDILPYASEILNRLTQIISVIAENPSNPKFNHFAFESVGALIRNICQANAQLIGEFEQFLFPPFQVILGKDVAEFMPYVFQLMAQMLAIHNEAGIPPAYQSMLPPLLTPALWESHGNIPALVGLLESYLTKGASEIVAGNQLVPILGIYNKLIASRMNDNFGIDLLMAVYENVPSANLATFNKNIFMLLLQRLKGSRTPKFVNCFLKFLSNLLIIEKEGLNADVVIGFFDSINPGLFRDMFSSVVLPGLAEMVQPDERKLFIIGMTNLLTRSTVILSDAYLPLWPQLITTVIELIKIPAAEGADVNPEDDLYIADVEEAGYQASFARLAAPVKKRNGVNGVDPSVYFRDHLIAFKAGPGGARVDPQVWALLG
ncbi:UNVERIFIED_CONTAM: importin-alpha export receptor [Siphonaria sp. JEL0065]|nr:importin-alpha export receptor [Siphonaria sp. JEL0065]